MLFARATRLIGIVGAVLVTCVNASAQFKVSGRVLTAHHKPIPGVNIVVKGTVKGTIAAADGFFSLSVPGDSAFLEFSLPGYSSVVRKVKGSEVITIRMAKLKSGSDWFIKTPRSKNPIDVRKDEYWTTSTYGVNSFPLVNNRPKARMAAWKIRKYVVSVPYDSLVRFLEESGLDVRQELEFLRAQKSSNPVLLPPGFLNEYQLLEDLAIRMIRMRAIVITGEADRQVETMEVRQVTAVYHEKNSGGGNSSWGGLEFWVTNDLEPLFVEVHVMT